MKFLLSEGGARRVALFGSGLIGSAVGDALRSTGLWRSRLIPYDWRDRGQREMVLATIAQELEAGTGRERPRFDIVWAAGISGFGSPPEHMGGELVPRVIDSDRSFRIDGPSVGWGSIRCLRGSFHPTHEPVCYGCRSKAITA